MTWRDLVRAELEADDEFVDVTGYGVSGPEYLIASRGCDRAVAKARSVYVDGLISIEQFESALDECLTTSG